MADPHGPAFPTARGSQNQATGEWTTHEAEPGLTKREHFAALAMQALLSDHRVGQGICDDERYTGNNFAELVAHSAVDFADALLAKLTEREKSGQDPSK